MRNTGLIALAHPPRLALALCIVATLSGCGIPPSHAVSRGCPAAQGAPQGDPLMAYQLFFGRSITGAGEVSDTAWNDFLERVVTPNLPDGYTVFDATGHWRDPVTSHSVQERSKVLLAVIPDTATGETAIARIRQAYTTQFHQRLVGLAVMPVCGTF